MREKMKKGRGAKEGRRGESESWREGGVEGGEGWGYDPEISVWRSFSFTLTQ